MLTSLLSTYRDYRGRGAWWMKRMRGEWSECSQCQLIPEVALFLNWCIDQHCKDEFVLWNSPKIIIFPQLYCGILKAADLSDSLLYNSLLKNWFFSILLLQLAVGQKTPQSSKETWYGFNFSPVLSSSSQSYYLFSCTLF